MRPIISGSVGNSLSNSLESLIASSHSGARAAVGHARRIAFVEDEVDHGGDSGEALGSRHGARRLEGDIGLGDAGFGAGDALLHRRFAHEEGARNLLNRETRDDAKRKGDLLGRRQLGMAADEEEPEDVVAIVGPVDALDDDGLGVGKVRDDRLGRQRLLPALAARRVDRGVLADHDQPGGRVARRTVLRPNLERSETGFLECLLRRIEILKVAEQRRHRLGARGRQNSFGPHGVDHGATFPALKKGSRQALQVLHDGGAAGGLDDPRAAGVPGVR